MRMGRKKKVTTIDYEDEPEREPEPEPEREPERGPEREPEPGPEEFFAQFEGLPDDAGLRFVLHRKKDDRLYYVGTVYPPVSAQAVATKFGGGEYKVTARKKDGKIAGNDWLYIDPDIYPPRRPDERRESETPTSVEAKLDKMIELLIMQRSQPSTEATKKEFLEEMMLYKELFAGAGGGGVSPESMMGLFTKGIETAREMGASGEKNMVDLVEKFAPEMLGAIKSAIDARREANAKMIEMKAGTKSSGNGKDVEKMITMSLLDDIFRAAHLQDPDQDFYLVLVDKKAPEYVKGKLASETPDTIIAFLSSLKKEYAELAKNEKVKAWLVRLITKYQTEFSGATETVTER